MNETTGWRVPAHRADRRQDRIMQVEELVIPFGEYTGLTVAEVAEKDLAYLHSVIEREYVKRKHRNLTEAINQVLRQRAAAVEKILE